MAVITKQELEDASADAQSLEDVVNGSKTLNGSGTVTTRLGQTIKTLAKVLFDLETTVGVSAAYSSIVKEDWAALLTLTGAADGQRAEVLTDNGTHFAASATGYNGAEILNEGVYSWRDDWARWVRIGELSLAQLQSQIDKKAQQTEVDYLISRLTGIYGSAEDSFNSQGLNNNLSGKTLVYLLSDLAGNLAVALDSDGVLNASSFRVLNKLLSDNFTFEKERSEHAFSLIDKLDNLGFAVKENGDLIVSGGSEISGRLNDWDFAIIDPSDFVGFGIKNGILYFADSELSTSGIVSLNERNKSFSETIKLSPPKVQLPTSDYNIVMNYGQSLGEGSETWPSLSKSPQAGALMVGDNVDNQDNDIYTVIGAFQFNPLVSYTAVGGANLDGAGEGALSPGDQAKGEIPVIGLTNGLKYYLNRREFSENNGKNLVAMSSAQGGKTVEQLSKINTQDAVIRYNGVIDGITNVVTLAASSSCVVSVVTWFQGERDYNTSHGSTNTTRALYKAALNTLFNDFAADIPAITSQLLPPLFLSYQTGATYTRDIDSNGDADLHVGMAQLEVCLERDDAVMFGPVYPYTDKGGHLDSNGSRWAGHQMAKVARRVFYGEGWQPLRPIQITQQISTLFVHFHVPVAPLQFKNPYVINSATSYEDKGFRVTSSDGLTAYSIKSVEVVSETIIKIELNSAPPTDALLWYADKTSHNGNGNLCDSDPELAIDLYEYVPERGMYASANIPELVGKRYPLHNWCVAFCLPLTYSEF